MRNPATYPHPGVWHGALRCYASQVDAVTDSTLDDLLGTYRRELTDRVQEKLES